MGWRWRKSIKLLPGIRLNLSHRGARLGVGSAPFSTSFRLLGSGRGSRANLSVPGTGLSYSAALSAPKVRTGGQNSGGSIFADFDKREFRDQLELTGRSHIPPVSNEAFPSVDPAVQRSVLRAALTIYFTTRCSNARQRTAVKRAVESELAALGDAEFSALVASIFNDDESDSREATSVEKGSRLSRLVVEAVVILGLGIAVYLIFLK